MYKKLWQTERDGIARNPSTKLDARDATRPEGLPRSKLNNKRPSRAAPKVTENLTPDPPDQMRFHPYNAKNPSPLFPY